MFASPHLLLAIAALGAPLATAPTNDSKPCTAVQALEAERTPGIDVPGRAPIDDTFAPTDPRVERASLEPGSALPGDPPPMPDLTRIAALTFDRVAHAVEDDGTPWVRGSNYKARFGAEGAQYTPFLGSDAPRVWPVGFSLASVLVGDQALDYERSSPALRDGDGMRYERGSLTERYEIRIDSIEQIFVLHDLPKRGEVVLRIAVATDLTACETSEAIEFANQRGAVRYGRATAFDATGASVAAATTLIGDEIEIRVPAEFVAAAHLPLVIDPVISTWTFGSGSGRPSGSQSEDDRDLFDCAYDATYARWLIVWLDAWSTPTGNAGHVAWRLVGALNGQTIASGITGNHLARNLRCANNNASNQFLLSWMPLDTGTVVAQTISAANGGLSGLVTVDTNGSSREDFLCVGGDPYPAGPSYFVVGWSDSATNTVRYRLLNGTTLVGSENVIPRATVPVIGETTELAISRSNGGSYWNVVWEEGGRIRATRISWSGGALAPVPILFSQTFRVKGLSASHALDGTNRWAFTFGQRPYSNPSEDTVSVVLVDGLSYVDGNSLSTLAELSGSPYTRGSQSYPSIDTDGRSFAITYIDLRGPHPSGIIGIGSSHVATVTPVGNRLYLSEFQTVDYGQVFPARIASTHGSGLPWRLNLLLYRSIEESNSVRGALYDDALYTSFCHPGYEGVPSCPCGNTPAAYGRGCNNQSNTGGAKLYGSGISSVSSDSMLLTGLNLPTNQTVFFYQGTSPLSTAVFSGRGLRCVGGTHILLYTKPSYPLGTQGYSTAPNPGDVRIAARSAQLGNPILAGQTRQYYASYRTNGTSGGGNGFAACTVGFSANTTQSLQAVWIP